MSCFRQILGTLSMLVSAACSHGPERTVLELGNFIAEPHSHRFAVSLGYTRIKDPTGLINTFPNGGIPKLMYREARVYRGDLDRGTVDLVAAIPHFAGIPQPKSVSIEGWHADVLYFSLFGYGGNAREGDDLSDERRLFYRVNADGGAQAVDALPPHLERGDNSGPVTSSPFLRWSQGHLDVEIAMDARISDTPLLTRLTFEPDSGEPRLSVP